MECNNVGSEGLVDYTSQFISNEVFKSKEELLGWVRDVGRENGFVIVIKTSDYGGSHKTPRIFLACERSGQYRAHKKLEGDDSSKKIVKITGTKKCGCLFELRARKLMADDDWMVDVACGIHNHAPAKHFEGHSFVGRLSEEETSLLVDMSKSMVRPKEILVTLKRKDALNVTTMKTIYNVRHRNNVIEKAGRSQMQHLLGELEKHNYIKWHRCDNNTMTVTDLFWAHLVNLDLLRSFPKVLTMDCTYKTNRYRLPLLEIVGVTSTDMSFSIAFANLQFERIDNYVWVLTTLRSLLDDIAIPEVIVTDRELALMHAIDRVFSTSRHLSCRWHIDRNVLSKYKKMFKSKEEWDKFVSLWNFLVLSSTELEYNEHLARLLADFDTYPEAVQYVLQNHVLAESKRANDVGIDASVCGCLVRQTHGLPCAHEIADYIRQGRPIPLDSINPHWRTLEVVQKLKNDKVELRCEPKFDLILKRFNASDYTTQLEILHKLGEIADPQSSFLIEPDVKPNPRGKGHKKIDVSTRRDPCAFELVQSGHDSHSPVGTQIPTQDSVKVHKKRPAKEQVYRTRTSTTYSYVDALPVELKPYICLIKDVDAAGNCGFRAIISLMGLTEAEWGKVRRDLLQELHTHVDHYTYLYGSHDRIEELTHILSYFEPNPGYHLWMTMPDMGHLIASCYNVVLYHLSAQQCLTFLPLRSVPISQLQRREIVIGFVNGNHFVQVFMLPGHPVPPIATNWCKFHHSCAAGWDTTYSR
ncbi:uncharacterized protein LOC114323158 [Camellia sinensis]|uniref:uncharacterized protein LOC114323158 n=1 Tax=Camellia sinensis TaxID=4442 RepID=UPI0010359189|nr:uncharacterized protein LOC114323158 [Camellia sinensis]